MSKTIYTILITFSILSCTGISDKISDAELTNLKTELDSIWEMDQKYRAIASELRIKNEGRRTEVEADLWLKQAEIDSFNMLKIERIIAKYGYPGKSLVGEDLKSIAAFVIIHNPSKQEKYLPLLWSESKKGNVDTREVAILEDRILMLKGKKQIYGTAMKYDTIGFDSIKSVYTTKLKVWEIQNYSNLDKKREKVGWYSFKKQCEYSNIDIKNHPEYKHQPNIYDNRLQ
jgi:hypothetical protein